MDSGLSPHPFEASPEDPRLIRAIGTPWVRECACELIRLCRGALTELRRLDEILYREVASTGQPLSESARDAASLRRLWTHIFGSMGTLLAYCRELMQTSPQITPLHDTNGQVEDFDIKEATGSRQRPQLVLDLQSVDIRPLFDEIDGLGSASEKTDTEKWANVLREVAAVEYGLNSLLRDAEERRETALRAGLVRQALAILDETQGAASEGVHALILAVYKTFVPEADPTLLVPGFLTLLDRALLVRRGIAALSDKIEPLNILLQGPDPSLYPATLAEIRRIMRDFVKSRVCHAMRAADRWEIEKLECEIATSPLPEARKACEGLAKYLESLTVINQREVLVVHDRKKIEELREHTANARGLFEIHPKAAADMILKGYEAARAIRGRSKGVDRLLDKLEELIHENTTTRPSMGCLESLEEIVATAHV